MPHALILVGGFGTRLRPLTLDFPKPLVPFANEEMIFHQIRALYNVGVRVVVLAVASPSTPGQPHQKKHLEEPIRKWHAELPGLEIKINEEEIPLGTAGPIKLGKHLLFDGNKDNLAFVLNSDVTCRYPFAQMLELHTANKALGTILVTPVKDPSRFGVVQFENQEDPAAVGGKVLGFFEKPQEYKGNCINAGVYLLDLSIIDKYIKGDDKTPCSIERQVFPEMQKDNVLYALQLPKDNYWADIGQPEDYITGLGAHLQDMGRNASDELAKQEDAKAAEYTLVGNCLIDPSAKIGKKCTIGPNVTIGANCVIGDATKLSNCAVFSNVKIGMATRIKDSIVSNYCQIGNYCHFEKTTVLGQCIVVNDDVHLSNIRGINSFTIKASAENQWLAY